MLGKTKNIKILTTICMVRATICSSSLKRALCLVLIWTNMHRSTMINLRQALTHLKSDKALPGVVEDKMMKVKALVLEAGRDREIADNMVTIKTTRGLLEAMDKGSTLRISRTSL